MHLTLCRAVVAVVDRLYEDKSLLARGKDRGYSSFSSQSPLQGCEQPSMYAFLPSLYIALLPTQEGLGYLSSHSTTSRPSSST